MTKWPWPNKFDQLDGGKSGKTQGAAKSPRGLRASRARAAGVVIEKLMPGWMRQDIKDVTPAILAKQNEAEQDDAPDRRSVFEKKHGIRNRQASMTGDQFYTFITAAGNMKAAAGHLDRIEIDLGNGSHAEFIFKGSSDYDRHQNLETPIVKLSSIRKGGVSGALGNDQQKIIASECKIYGLLRGLEIDRALSAAHGAVQKNHEPKEVKKLPVYFGRAFSSLSQLQRIVHALREKPEGHVLQGRINFLPPHRHWSQWEDEVLPVARLVHPNFAGKISSEFRRVGYGSNALYATGGGKPPTVGEALGLRLKALFPNGHPIMVEHLERPVAILLPPDYPAPSPQSPDPAL